MPKCNEVELLCQHAECEKSIQRQHLIEHEKICPHRLIKCDFCQQQVKSASKEVWNKVSPHVDLY